MFLTASAPSSLGVASAARRRAPSLSSVVDISDLLLGPSDHDATVSSWSEGPKRRSEMSTTEDKLGARRRAALATPSELGAEAVKNITGALNALLADVFALYMKTKNLHWHVSGPHFRDYHLLLDEHAG